jgi:hypothetical protein
MKMFALATLALVFSTTAFAQKGGYTSVYRSPAAAYSSEITTSATGGVFFSGKRCKDCESGSDLVLGLGYLHTLTGDVQVGGEGTLRMLSKYSSGTGDSETLFDIVGVGAWNFSHDFANAIFAKAGIGLYSVIKDDRAGYENKLGFFIGGGKRWMWLNNVAYSPEVRLVKKGDIDLGFEIQVINFSLYW